jgi:hypothetical protein
MRTLPRMSHGAALTAALLLAACSSSKSGDATGSHSPADAGPAIGSASLKLAPPEHGFQLTTIGTMIDPGQDTEYCEVVAVPGTPADEYFVSRTEIQMTKFSHHLIVSSVDPTAATKLVVGKEGVQPCFGAQELVGFTGSAMIGGSQLDYLDRHLPSGVGMKLHGGDHLIFDYHYYNTSQEAVHTGHKMNFHTVDASQIQHIGHSMAFVNFTIDTPPGAKKQFQGECRFSDDVMVGSLIRHTHQWGRDFTAWFAGGPSDTQPIWTSKGYEDATEYAFPKPVLMKKDTGFRFECDYENTTDRALKFGLKATDEMCILFGLYWEPTATPVKSQACIMRSIDADGIARGQDFSTLFGADGGLLGGDGGFTLPKSGN